MRWFKHMADSHNDEKLADLVTECGMEAYGFWWMLLEIVALKMDKNSTICSVTYTLSKWSQLLYCHHHTVSKYLGKLEVRGMVRLEYGEGKGYSKVTVTIPNLLKYRDEYSKKSGQNPDKIRPKIIDTDTEADIKIKEGDKSPEDIIWKLGIKLLTDAGAKLPGARSFLGKHVKNGNKEKLAGVISQMSIHPPIDPLAYIEKAMQPKKLEVQL